MSAVPIIDIHQDFIEVWWHAPEVGVPYQVLLDRWDYDGLKPVRFVYVISEALS